MTGKHVIVAIGAGAVDGFLANQDDAAGRTLWKQWATWGELAAVLGGFFLKNSRMVGPDILDPVVMAAAGLFTSKVARLQLGGTSLMPAAGYASFPTARAVSSPAFAAVQKSPTMKIY